MFVRVVCMFACECASKNVQDMRARKQTDFALLLTCAGVCTVFQQQSLRLAYTPRKCAPLLDAGALVIVEADHNAEKGPAKDFKMTAVPGVDPVEGDLEGEGRMPYQSFGVQRAGEGKWASCVRVVDISQRVSSKQVIDLAEVLLPTSGRQELSKCLGRRWGFVGLPV
jgi:hypothetical protein